MTIAKGVAGLTEEQARAEDAAYLNLRDALESSDNKHRWDDLWHQRIHPESRVVSILGGRGTGKTTVLQSVLERLGHDMPKVQVLPILDATVPSRDDSLRYYLTHLLEQAIPLPEPNRDNTTIHAAKAALRDLRANMVGSDTAWRGATAQLSTTQSDYAVYSEMRVDSTLGFAVKLNTATEALCRALGKRALVFSLDDMDLAPQRLLELLGVINELRYVRRFVTLLAADLDDAQIRLYGDLWRQVGLTRHEELTHGDALEEHTSLARSQWQTAERMLAKLLPERYRSSIGTVTPMLRPAFPPSKSRRRDLEEPTRHVRSIGAQLLAAGIASYDTLAWRSDDHPQPSWRAPLWGYALAPTSRSLAAYDFTKFAKSFPAAERSWLAKSRKNGTSPPASKSDQAAVLIPTPCEIPREVLGSLAVIARIAGLTAWSFQLEFYAESQPSNGLATMLLLQTNFDLSRDFIDPNPLHDCSQLSRAVREGLSVARWLPFRPGSELAKMASRSDPDINLGQLAPLCADVLLRYLPYERNAFILSWGFARSVMAEIRVQIRAGRPNETKTEMNFLEFFSIFTRLKSLHSPDSVHSFAWPLATSWSDMMELLEELSQLPPVTQVHVSASDRRALPITEAALRELERWAPALGNVDGYLAFLTHLLRLKQVRCDLARRRPLAIFGESRIDSELGIENLTIQEMLVSLARRPAAVNEVVTRDAVGAEDVLAHWNRMKTRRPVIGATIKVRGMEIRPLRLDSYRQTTKRVSSYDWDAAEVWQQFLLCLPERELLSPHFWVSCIEAVTRSKRKPKR